MTPGARVQAAIEVLGRVLPGAPAERELTAWARASRYAGSKDRAAVRDHVFDALRRLRSSAWTGGQGDVAAAEMDPRAVLAGLLAAQGDDPATLFTGRGHAPEPIDLPDAVAAPPDAVRLDVPDWLLPSFRGGLGANCDAVLDAMRHRAPVFLRANLLRTTRAEMLERLASDGHDAEAGPLSDTAIRLPAGIRGLANAPVYLDGLVEFQDAGSQALVDRLPVRDDARLLDLCAGGGGKALALAGRGAGPIFAHDADPRRMRDLPARAGRAGARITLLDRPEAEAPFDGVVADVPCSGSGSWRRAPEAKWRLTPARLAELNAVQDQILDRAVALTRPGGWVAYMTCSLLTAENEARVDACLARRDDLRLTARWACTPLDGADGFHLSLLEKAA